MKELLNIKKEYILIAGGVVLLLVAYQFAFKKTIEAWHLHSSLEQQVQQSNDLSLQPAYLERKSHNLDKIIKLYKTDTLNFRSDQLNIISSIAEGQNAKLSELPNQDNYTSTSTSAVLRLGFEGDYFSLVKTLNTLESKNGIGIVRAVEFVKPGNGQSFDKKNMSMLVYLQTAKN